MTTTTKVSSARLNAGTHMVFNGKTFLSKNADNLLAPVTSQAAEAHIAAHEAEEAAASQPVPETTIKLNKKERQVLEAIFEGISAETKGDFCYFDSFVVDNLTDAQLKGYLSSLSKKGVISCDGDFHQINLMDVARQLVPADFLASFKHGFETIASMVAEEVKSEPADKRTKLDLANTRRFGQIIRRVFRSRNIKVSVNLDTEDQAYIVILMEGSFAKFQSIAESQFSVKPSVIAQDHSYIKFSF